MAISGGNELVDSFVLVWGRRACLGITSFLTLLVCCNGLSAQELNVRWTDQEMRALATTFDTMYSVNWQAGIPPEMDLQSARLGDISVVGDPSVAGRHAVQISISSDEDFSRVANGSPRAEMVFPASVRFTAGKDYLVSWATYIPQTFQSDPNLSLIITQIHQGAWSGPPPVMLAIRGENYEISERGGAATSVSGKRLCCAFADKGKWIYWTLRYVPDPTGYHALTQLWKDGLSVYASRGIANAYADGQDSYLKMGLYKTKLEGDSKNVNRIVMTYGAVSVGRR